MARARFHHPVVLAVGLLTALVVGCSYDWEIGDGVPNEAPIAGDSGSTIPAPTTPGGSTPVPRQDAGVPEAGATGGECGTSCACKGEQNCAFTCTKPPCTLTCSNNSTCKMTCGPTTANCRLNCEDRANCNMDCAATGVGGQCIFEGERNSNCRGTCQGQLFCEVDDCDVVCRGAFCR